MKNSLWADRNDNSNKIKFTETVTNTDRFTGCYTNQPASKLWKYKSPYNETNGSSGETYHLVDYNGLQGVFISYNLIEMDDGSGRKIEYERIANNDMTVTCQ